MTTDGRFDESVSRWLEQTAPSGLPERVLESTFERTRGSRQRITWRGRLGRMHVARSVAALGGTAAAVTVAGVLVLGSLAAVGGPIATPDPRSPLLGTWISTSDADGGLQTMTLRPAPDDAVEVVVSDDVATVCASTPSTMTGTGRLEGSTRLVIATPAYTCDDGSTPRTEDGQPLEQVLRGLTYLYDPRTDVLTVGPGSVWTREGATAPSPAPSGGPTGQPVWPQTSLEEVRQAQELADAGDPRYTWQVSRDRWYQPGQHHPTDAAFFARFIEENLGWEAFRWDEAFAHPDGLEDGDVVYVRCAANDANPLYSDGPKDRCAPTIDETQYETVKINVAQLDRQGAPGIWVVTGWEIIEPSAQVVPPSDAEIAAFLEPFLQARVDGAGAEGFAEIAETEPTAGEPVVMEVPLLYATSDGASYERSTFELVDGPAWPTGRMHLEVRLSTKNDEAVVRQVFSLERDETGRLRLVYDVPPSESEGPLPTPATTENGKAVPVEHAFLDGEVTYRVTHPLAPSQDGFGARDRVAIVGLLPDDDATRRILVMLADPRPIGPACEVAPAPADAADLAQSLQADPDLQATAPKATTIGGAPALQLDVARAPGARSCPWTEHGISGAGPILLQHAPFAAGPYFGDRARLYLVDVPGDPGRVLAIATITDDDSFETVRAWAEPIVDSIEFHAP